MSHQSDTAIATFAGGCFWCIEAALKQLEGVHSATSGYCGGHVEDPSYEEVCSGTTGHAEAVRVVYDPDVISYEELLEIFFKIHDPTQLNRQGPDIGEQYRSAIFYHDETQRELAEGFIEELEAADIYDDSIVTEVAPLDTFYEAEEYHQDYFEKNPDDAYCTMHAQPKIEKVRKEFAEKVRAKA
ncbi:MAG: peptide-methionine (S)-S-oxide reductase MsrA [Halobacteriales archaeon]